jgi:LuxR family maltose regulon positive regulatory protein
VYYKIKEKEKAFATLLDAYEMAAPNNIVMPFIELGKDMRTLTSSALLSGGSIPRVWLENINRRAATYAKRRAYIISEYKQAHRIVEKIVLSPRELEILTDLYHGLSRAEIAANRSISRNTVKMVIQNIYIKVGAKNIADLIRIAIEQKLI